MVSHAMFSRARSLQATRFAQVASFEYSSAVSNARALALVYS